MNTVIDKVEKLINETPTSNSRNELTDINIILHEQLNLCDTCKFEIPTCKGSFMEFGNGRGDDNVIKCKTYNYKNKI